VPPSPAEYLEDLGAGITLIDTGYGRPAMDACYLLVDHGEAAYVDTGTALNLDRLLAALAAAGVPPAAVRHVILTHVHLDHAAGAGPLMAELPGATLVVHPRGAPHMIDPTRLAAGAAAVYGEDGMRTQFGAIRAVPADRVVEAQDGAVFALGTRRLACLHTPGHARHHMAIFDQTQGNLFAGDTFGLCYRELHGPDGPFLLPTTSPVQFEPGPLHASVDRIRALNPARVMVTHFGAVTGIERLAMAMHRRVDALADLALALPQTDPDACGRLVAAIESWAMHELAAEGVGITPARMREVLGPDIRLNAEGLLVWKGRGHT